MLEWLIPALVAIAAILMITFPLHEVAHAWTADHLGDPTPRRFGRLTLNPIAHFDRVGGTLVILSVLLSQGTFVFGWAKTPVQPGFLRGGQRGHALVAAAGPAMNLAIAVVAALALRVIGFEFASGAPDPVTRALGMIMAFNILLMLLNLLPIPPLDGSQILYALLPPRTLWQVRPILEQYGLFILIVIMFLPPNRPIFAIVANPILNVFTTILVGA